MDSWCSMCCKATDDCVPEENKIEMFYFNSPCLRLFIFKEGPRAFQNVADINYLGNNGRTLSIPLGNGKIGEVPMKSLLRIGKCTKKNIFGGSIGRSIARKNSVGNNHAAVVCQDFSPSNISISSLEFP